LQDCKIARLQDCKIARLQDCKVARLQDCKIARLQDCKIGLGLLFGLLGAGALPSKNSLRFRIFLWPFGGQ